MPRALHIMRMSGASGSENQLVELVHALRPHGWESDVLIPSPAPGRLAGFAGVLERAGAGRAEAVPMPADLSPRLVRELGRRLRCGRYALAHSHLVHADWHLAAASAAAPRVALVSTKHNHDPFRTRRAVEAVERAAMARFDGVIAISRSLAAFTERHAGVPAATVHYGLRAEAPDAPPRSRVERLLAVGRLEPQKGYDVLLDAVARVPALRLRIAGDGTLRAALERRIAALGLESRVELLGQRGDVRELMREADLFVHAARWEGFGLVLLEAMRAQLPVVATAVGAVPEVVAAGETGLLVSPDDPRALADALLAYAADPPRASAAGVAGYARLRAHFHPDRMGAETASVYEGAMSRALSRRCRGAGSTRAESAASSGP